MQKLQLGFKNSFYTLLLIIILLPMRSSAADDYTKLKNPTNITDLTTFVKKILDIVLTIGIPIIAIAIIYAGYLFVSSRGNEHELKNAKNAIVWTLIGAAIILGAWVLAQALGNSVDCLRDQPIHPENCK